MGEADAAVGSDPDAATIGAARRHPIVHARELGPIDRRGNIPIG